MISNVGTQSAAAQKNNSCEMSKMVQYAKSIVDKAVAEEKAGDLELAVQYYLKAADILIIIANNTDNYNDWNTYSGYASNYHHKVSQLLQQIHRAKQS